LTHEARAERLATTRTRRASTEPSLLLACPCARPDKAERAASTGVEGIGLAALAAVLAVLPADFDDLDTR